MLTRDTDKVLSLLLMRFDLYPNSAIPVAEAWLAKRSDRSWDDLAQFIIEDRVVYEGGVLIDQPLQQQQKKNFQRIYRGRLL
ncbi:hypothetical protein [Synechococcus sp. PCC 7336]|uniref:hypothetical protein n=1 Tax=Synechococcus sp. PCC 7336 TaxID=195250 RepID=UPI0003480F4E|nr:hypothetical protein [Synechococcus sp. PCC 7336]